MSEFKVRQPTPGPLVDEMLKTGFCVECIRREIHIQGFSADNLPEVDVVARERNAFEGRCVQCEQDRLIVLHTSEGATAALRRLPAL
jgi:hypothetical protein